MTNKVRNFPLKILLSFLIITELLLFFGPIDYQISNSVLLAFYLAILNLSLYLGYKRGIRTFTPSEYRLSSKAIQLFIIIGTICLLADMIGTWSNRNLSVLNYYNVIVNGITDSGGAYYAEQDIAETSYFRLLLSPFSWACIPFCIYYWNRSNWFFKFLTIFNVFVILSTWLGIGVRKGIFDIIVIAIFSILARNPIIITDKKYYSRFKKVSISLCIVFVIYFIISNLSRYSIGGQDLSLSDLKISNLRKEYIEILSLPGAVALGQVVGYLCQGYKALSLALGIGFISPTFMGMSWFTIALVKKFGYDPTSGTYTKILEAYGYDMSINWHTAYVWLANDFTFIGVPFIIYFVGKYLATSWCDCLNGKNAIAFPVMALFVVMTFYLFANNQIFSFSFIPFVFWLGYYGISKIVK